MDNKNIVIVVEGGVVQEVKNLPPDWTYELEDHDSLPNCEVCGEPIFEDQEITADGKKHVICS